MSSIPALTPAQSIPFSNKVFVYGTLRLNQGNFHRLLLSNVPHFGTYTLQLPFQMYNLGAFPALVKAEGLHSITGDVFEIDAAMLSDLDWLEGYPMMYNRTTVSLPGTGHLLEKRAWMYFMPLDALGWGGGELIEGGDWVAYQENKE